MTRSTNLDAAGSDPVHGAGGFHDENPTPAAATSHPRQREVIGVVGGLGPYAHLLLERRLLEAARALLGASHDQDFPEWILASVPHTPDRTRAIVAEGIDPTPWLIRALCHLRGVADFAIVACNTAHHFLPSASAAAGLPILDMLDATAERIAARWAGARVGLLATTGALEARIHQDRLTARGLAPVSLLDLPDGAARQRGWVMEPIYGPWRAGAHHGGGIKGGGDASEGTAALTRAATALRDEGGATVLVAGCTEVPLALPGTTVAGLPLIDPMRVVAEAAIRRAFALPDDAA